MRPPLNLVLPALAILGSFPVNAFDISPLPQSIQDCITTTNLRWNFEGADAYVVCKWRAHRVRDFKWWYIYEFRPCQLQCPEEDQLAWVAWFKEQCQLAGED